jgi:AraC-like DNA-binding protein
VKFSAKFPESWRGSQMIESTIAPTAPASARDFAPFLKLDAPPAFSRGDAARAGAAKAEASDGQFRLARRVFRVSERVEFDLVNVMRDCTGLRQSDGGCAMIICLDGRFDAEIGATRIAMAPGRMLLVACHRPEEAPSAGAARTIGLWFDCEAARGFSPPAGEIALRERPPSDPAIAVLAAYCAQLMALPAGMPASLARLASRQLGDLVAHMLDPAAGLARAAPFGGPKAARLRAVLDHISANLSDPVLSAARVGARLGLTARCVQQLLEAVGLSFSQHVRQMRLDEARRLLGDPRHDHMRITDIAYAAGFQDLSYFNREFRRRFGEKPSAARGGA